MGSYPSRQGLNDRRGFNPPSFKMDPWDDHPVVCSACGADLLGVWFDAPGGAFCDASCAAPNRPVDTWYSITDEMLRIALADAAVKWKGRDADWNDSRKELGSIAEQYVSILSGVERGAWRAPDGGTDIADVDVKGREPGRDMLMRRVDSVTWAAWYAIAIVDLAGRRVRLVGHASLDDLRSAPVRVWGVDKRTGKPKPPTYSLPFSGLRPGLPPSLLA